MRDLKLLALALLVVIGGPSLADGKPTEAYPFRNQYPPVARVGEQINFQLSNDTFKSSPGESEITYAVYELPEWLSWDASNRVLSGSVPEKFVSEGQGDGTTRYFDIILEGTDVADGQKLNMTYSLVATKKKGPKLSPDFRLLNALTGISSGYGSALTNGRSALKLDPGEVVNVTFGNKVFENGEDDSRIVNYYGRSEPYHAPLPSWLAFYANDLKFSGIAPVLNSPIAPEMSYPFTLIATDFEGFSGAELKFELIVASHKLATSLTNRLIVNVDKDGSFDYDIPLKYVYLDDKPITKDKIRSTQLEPDAGTIPDWLHFNEQDYKLVGQLPNPESQAYNLTVRIEDKNSNVVYLDFSIMQTEKIFAVDSFPDLNATRGEWFQYTIPQSVFTNSTDLQIDAEYSNANWLKFFNSNMTFVGSVPDDFDRLSIIINAEKEGNKESLGMKLLGASSKRKFEQTSSSMTSETSASSTPTESAAVVAAALPVSPTNRKKNVSPLVLVCGIVIPLLFILLLILLFILWRRRKNATQTDDSRKDPEHKRNISAPHLGNPANNPNPFMDPAEVSSPTSLNEKLSDPFADAASSTGSTVKKLGVLNAMHLDDGSDHSYHNEKLSPADEYPETFHAPRKEDSFYLRTGVNEEHPTSSIYYNSEASNRKSWRYSSHLTQPEANDKGNRNLTTISAGTKRSSSSKSNRESLASSVRTVSTADFLNTEVSINSDLLQGSQRSLPLSANNKDRAPHNNNLPTLNELDRVPTRGNHKKELSNDTTESSSSGDSEFHPIKKGDIYQFTNKNSNLPMSHKIAKQHSTKRLVKLENKGGVNVSDASLIGQEPEWV